MYGNHMIDGDDGSSCQSPYHDSSRCRECCDYEKYFYCQICGEYKYKETEENADGDDISNFDEYICNECKNRNLEDAE